MKGPLHSLANNWWFKAARDGAHVRYWIAYEFKNPVLQAAISANKDKLASRIMAAFERAKREQAAARLDRAPLRHQSRSAGRATAVRGRCRFSCRGRYRRTRFSSCSTCAAAPRRGDVHEPDGLLRRAAVGTRDAGDGDSDVGGAARERAFDHRKRDGLAHRAVLLRSVRSGTPSISVFASFE